MLAKNQSVPSLLKATYQTVNSCCPVSTVQHPYTSTSTITKNHGGVCCYPPLSNRTQSAARHYHHHQLNSHSSSISKFLITPRSRFTTHKHSASSLHQHEHYNNKSSCLLLCRYHHSSYQRSTTPTTPTNELTLNNQQQQILQDKKLSMSTPPQPKISGTEFNILMVNDVYELVPDHRKLGGLAELSTIMKQERMNIERKHNNNLNHCIVTLNGDFLSASQLAFRYQGAHMIKIMNQMPIQYVVPGNHEFDFGSTVLEKRIRESKFKWICSNIFYKNTNKIMNGMVSKVVLTVPCDRGVQAGEPMDEIKIGIFGLCTPATKNLSQPGDEIEFRDIIDTARKMVKELREDDGVDVVIALTHLSIKDDNRLAEEVRGIDVELGGHDHSVITNQQKGVFIHKAGVNGQYLGNIKLIVEKTVTHPFGKEFKQVHVFPEWKMIMNRGYEPDPNVKSVVDYYQSKLPSDYNDIIGVTETKLNSYSDSVRSKETTMGNLIADVLLETFNADLAIINGGSIRGDRTYDAGYEITRGDIYKEFPFPSGVSLQCIKGQYLIEALEQGLSKAELNLGAFPHLSKGCRLVFDKLEKPMQRVKQFELNGEPIDPERVYNICSTNYMLSGGDGYTALKHYATIVEHENNNRSISNLVMEYIETKRIVSAKKEGRISLFV